MRPSPDDHKTDERRSWLWGIVEQAAKRSVDPGEIPDTVEIPGILPISPILPIDRRIYVCNTTNGRTR